MQKNWVLVLSFWFLCTSYVFSTDKSVKIEVSSASAGLLSPYLTYSMTLDSEETYHIDAGQLFTAIKITSADTLSNQIYLTLEENTYHFGTLITDETIDIPPSFIIPLNPSRYFKLKTRKPTTVKIELFYAPRIEIPATVNKNKKERCEKPNTIPSSQWRKGLPDPKPGRVTSEVNHCIIHHSAGNTADTNYTNIIRNIYLLHTESNGWDDIGYNYMVAGNGQIYNGRDPQGAGDEDNIQGAHFCAKNSGTMGICLLGNYEIDTPSISLIKSVEKLLTWKLYKENLSAKDSSIHPPNSSKYLATIGQHKDGCTTLCPGKNTTNLITDIRNNVQENLDKCANIVSVSEPLNSHYLKIYPNPSDGRFFVMSDDKANLTHYELISYEGESFGRVSLAKNGMIRLNAATGLYSLALWSNNSLIFIKTIIVQ
ncbi:MAG: hypothetical protein ACI9GO_000793 [Bacteroidia bacterium]|jgi:hypothetical protein